GKKAQGQQLVGHLKPLAASQENIIMQRASLLLIGAIIALPFFIAGFADSAPPAPKTEEFTGKVVSLAGPLEKFGAKLDKDAAPFWLALVTADGKSYPLIKDSGSRM